MAQFFKSRLFFVSLVVVILAATLPLYVSGYILGLLTVAYYFGVFAMAWDLLFGFAGEVNFGPTFLIGVGAYTAGILNNQYGWSVYLCILLGAMASVFAGFVLALPALAGARPLFRTDDAGRRADAAEFHRRVRRSHRRRDRPHHSRRDHHQCRRQLLDRARLHDHQRRHPVRAVAVAGRPRAAGQRPGSGAGRRARLQHRQAQARGLRASARSSRACRARCWCSISAPPRSAPSSISPSACRSSSPPCSADGAPCWAPRWARSS